MLMYEVELQIIDKEVIKSFPRTADPSVVLYCGFTRSKHTGIVILKKDGLDNFFLILKLGKIFLHQLGDCTFIVN